MRIAQVSPLYEAVPPRLYGGTERVVSYLTEELVRQGHEVTLFASGDSQTSAALVPCCAEALRLDPRCIDPVAHHILQMERVMARARDFDVIHCHVDYFAFPLARRVKAPQLTTLHGRLDLRDLEPVFDEFSDYPVVSISNHQRGPLPQANFVATVYHGLPEQLYEPRYEAGRYLAFLGRISPEKRVDRAIEIAGRVGIPLKIAAKISKADEVYFKEQIEPLLDQPHVEFIGEIGEHQKQEFLQHAVALLFPIDWPEPFGLVMIEAMACGTPVIAYEHGSVPEVMKDGVSGFVVRDLEEAVRAAERIEQVDRHGCRSYFEERFSARRMARDYLRVYRRLGAKPRRVVRPLSTAPRVVSRVSA